MAKTRAQDAGGDKKRTPSPKQKRAKKDKKEKDPEAPKRPRSAYMIWLSENRARLTQPGMPVTEVSKAAGVEWNALQDKSQWESRALADKLRYQEEMAKYTANKA